MRKIALNRYSLDDAIAELERELDRFRESYRHDVGSDEYARALASWIVDATEPDSSFIDRREPVKKIKVRINTLFE